MSDNNSMHNIKHISQVKWDKVSNENIYFGHQSVGYNMIDGMLFILEKNPNIGINIKEDPDLKAFNNSFVHGKNGKNGYPKSKIDSFYELIDQKIGGSVDIAGFKFCYADFNENTDVNKVFEYYEHIINNINEKYPDIDIIHCTVPLQSIQTGPKAWIKKILNKSVGIENNHVRQQFNDLLLNKYNKQYVFDLAKYESTHSDGSREFTLLDNNKVYSMAPEYTDDGGHLTNKGKNYIGAQYLIFLSNIVN